MTPVQANEASLKQCAGNLGSRTGSVLTLRYVSHVSKGHDSWCGVSPTPGGSNGPFAHFEQARLAVQMAKAQQTGLTAINVEFLEGTYYLPDDPALDNKPEVLTAADSGTASMPITYEAYLKAKVTRGGLSLDWEETGPKTATSGGTFTLQKLPRNLTQPFETSTGRWLCSRRRRCTSYLAGNNLHSRRPCRRPALRR